MMELIYTRTILCILALLVIFGPKWALPVYKKVVPGHYFKEEGLEYRK